VSPDRFGALWRSLTPIGRDSRTGGYLRYGLSSADLACRDWVTEEAHDRDLSVETDRNGNLFAWWGDPAAGDAVLTGSHLDSVPQGGAYDGALGVVSGLLAIDLLRERGLSRPSRPIGIAVFAEEEGARFGVPCLGSRLLTGSLDPARALALRDADGVRLADALATAGVDPAGVGPDPQRLGRLGTFVELHIEQGRALADLDRAVGVASAIWPHGRWRLDVRGEGNHAGTTRLADRCDPLLTTAFAVLAANKEARLLGAHATIGRLSVTPNATNAIASHVSAWLDARAPDRSTVDDLVAAVARRVAERASRDGTTAAWSAESVSEVVEFDVALRDKLAAALRSPDDAGGAPILATGAGHDAGVLAGHVPTAMLFVRNPTGVSHAPAEHASDVDCYSGVEALATVLGELVGA
jgi:N-carbamoyl-L-amino-acid hydrolase